MKPWSLAATLVNAAVGLAYFAVHFVLVGKAGQYALVHDFNMVWFSVAVLSSWFIAGFVISWLRPNGFLGATLGSSIGWLALLANVQSAEGTAAQLRSLVVLIGIVAAGEITGRMLSAMRHRAARRGA